MNKIITLMLMFMNCFLYSDNQVEMDLDKLINDHIDHIKNINNWQLDCVGKGMPLMKITNITVGFSVIGTGTISDARRYLLESSQDLLYRINDSEKIRDHLINFPFESKNIEYSINFTNQNHDLDSPLNEPISFALLMDGCINYAIFSEKSKQYETIYEETYSEALQKINN